MLLWTCLQPYLIDVKLPSTSRHKKVRKTFVCVRLGVIKSDSQGPQPGTEMSMLCPGLQFQTPFPSGLHGHCSLYSLDSLLHWHSCQTLPQEIFLSLSLHLSHPPSSSSVLPPASPIFLLLLHAPSSSSILSLAHHDTFSPPHPSLNFFCFFQLSPKAPNTSNPNRHLQSLDLDKSSTLCPELGRVLRIYRIILSANKDTWTSSSSIYIFFISSICLIFVANILSFVFVFSWFHYIALATTMQLRLSLNSQRTACLCLLTPKCWG